MPSRGPEWVVAGGTCVGVATAASCVTGPGPSESGRWVVGPVRVGVRFGAKEARIRGSPLGRAASPFRVNQVSLAVVVLPAGPVAARVRVTSRRPEPGARAVGFPRPTRLVVSPASGSAGECGSSRA
jgi:hypothetical protein